MFEDLRSAALELEAYIMRVMSSAPSPPTGSPEYRELAALLEAAGTHRLQLTVALSKFIGPAPPLSPVTFWACITIAKDAKNKLPILAGMAARQDGAWAKKSGRAIVDRQLAPEPTLLQQVAGAATSATIAVAALAGLILFVWAVK